MGLTVWEPDVAVEVVHAAEQDVALVAAHVKLDDWPAVIEAGAALNVTLGGGVTVTVVLAERAFRRGRTGGFQLWWLLTIILAVTFLGSTASEWQRLIFKDHLTISTNLFGTTFYSVVGLHATHVIVGLILLVLVLILSLRGYVREAHAEHIEMLSWYWHFVDGVWVIVFTVVYIIGR